MAGYTDPVSFDPVMPPLGAWNLIFGGEQPLESQGGKAHLPGWSGVHSLHWKVHTGCYEWELCSQTNTIRNGRICKGRCCASILNTLLAVQTTLPSHRHTEADPGTMQVVHCIGTSTEIGEERLKSSYCSVHQAVCPGRGCICLEGHLFLICSVRTLNTQT